MVTDLSATSSIIVTIIAILRLYSAVIVLAVISAFLVQVITIVFVITSILDRLDLGCLCQPFLGRGRRACTDWAPFVLPHTSHGFVAA